MSPGTPEESDLRWREPVPKTPWEAYEKGIHNEEARLHGFNRYESAPFLLFDRTTAANYPDRVRAWFGADAAEKVLELYPATDSAAAADGRAPIEAAAVRIPEKERSTV